MLSQRLCDVPYVDCNSILSGWLHYRYKKQYTHLMVAEVQYNSLLTFDAMQLPVLQNNIQFYSEHGGP
jgi:hypothetical protein